MFRSSLIDLVQKTVFPLSSYGASELDPKAHGVAPGGMIRGYRLTAMADSDVDGGAAPDLPAGGQGLCERPAGCGVVAAGANDPAGAAGGRPRKTDMRAAMNATLYLLRTGCPWRYLPRDSFPPRSTVYNIFRKFQRDGVWDAIWAELHMALRERMGREPSPSAAVLDSQSIKSAEKGVVTMAKWVTTLVSR
jgi:transposase